MSALTPHQFNQFLLPFISEQTSTVYVGYSGGVDSTVLLHLAQQCCQSLEHVSIGAIHVNHQLSENARQWQLFCQQQCEQLGVTFIAKTVVIESNQQGLEAEARKVRYQAFEQVMAEHQDEQVLLLLGQHCDDQAETLLLQLKRGAGVKGLAAMAQSHPLSSNGQMLRPLLSYSRQQVLQYAVDNQLNWIEDESNLDCRFDRNFIRQQLMPQLTERWPGFVKAVNRTAQHMAEQQTLLDDLAVMDLATLDAMDNHLDIIALAQLAKQSQHRANNVLRYWLSMHKVLMPSTVILSRVFSELALAAQDKMPIIEWQQFQLRRFKSRIYLLGLHELASGQDCIWHDLATQLTLKAIDGEVLGYLDIKGDKPLEGVNDSASEQMSVRFAKAGQYNQLRVIKRGNDFAHKLSDIFKQHHIPPWQRSRVPLLYWGEQLIAVVGLLVCDSASTTVLSTHQVEFSKA